MVRDKGPSLYKSSGVPLCTRRVVGPTSDIGDKTGTRIESVDPRTKKEHWDGDGLLN